MSRALGALLGLLLVASPAAAQGSKPLFKYGKFALAAGAVAMNYLAARAHERANDNFDALERRCLDDHELCLVNTHGRYADRESESLYQESLRYDRQARRWLIGGETALLGAGAIFVWELTKRTHKPDNIPFEPEIRSLRWGTGVGVRVKW